jgi:hypothetical protein
MTNYLNDVTDSDLGDGRSVLDTIGPLKRFDTNRLVIGIRENGINESATNLTAGQLSLSTNYPDRSLIWINQFNGQPAGIAMKVGLYPVPLDTWFISNSIAVGMFDYTNQYYWSFDVATDGRIYTGYKNKILRYNPDGNGGISPVPQVVFTLTTNDPVHGNLYNPAGSFPIIRVRGTGTNTVLVAGGMSSSRGAYRLITTNGTNFMVSSWLPGGAGNAGSGSFSSLIPSPEPGALPGEEWIFGSSYPGSSTGADTAFGRMFTAQPYYDPTNNFAHSPGFAAGIDPALSSPKYTANFVGSVDANTELDYMAAYSTPSWNSFGTIGGTNLPAWLALHNVRTGSLIASRLINIRETNAFLPFDNQAKWEASHGHLTLNKLPGGDIEILWCSGVYGYGRYLVDPKAKITNFSAVAGSASIIFQAPTLGQVQRATNLDFAFPLNVGFPVAPGTAVIDNLSPPNRAFYRVKLTP